MIEVYKMEHLSQFNADSQTYVLICAITEVLRALEIISKQMEEMNMKLGRL